MTTREDLIDDDLGLWAEPAEDTGGLARSTGARSAGKPTRITAEWLEEVLRRADAIIVRDEEKVVLEDPQRERQILGVPSPSSRPSRSR